MENALGRQGKSEDGGTGAHEGNREFPAHNQAPPCNFLQLRCVSPGFLDAAEHPDAPTFLEPGAKPNPEPLFAGAFAACFHSAMLGVAKALGTPLTDSVLHARVGQVKDDAGDSHLVVELRAHLPGVADDKTRELMETAHKLCPYSKALRGDAVVELVAG